jgi:hypothetical protein
MFPTRNVGLVPFGFTRAWADRIGARLIDSTESALYAAWYWRFDPSNRDDRGPVSRGPVPDGIAVWTSRRVLLIALRFAWAKFRIAEAEVVGTYPTGVALPVLVSSGSFYDSATIHGETFWFVHDCVPSGFS